MKITSRAITMMLSAGILGALLVPAANAGCGDLSSLQGPFEFASPSAESRLTALANDGGRWSQHNFMSASIVGLWKIQLVSKGNTGHNPSIPDGAIIDIGYSQWHSDGTEILNSGGRAPATENFCLGVWGMTGYLAYELNHFALSYDAPSGSLNARVNIREQVTLSPSGDTYTGTFTIDVYAPNGDHVDHLAGTTTGTRLTVDSTLP
jgi:hypothetical protein